MIIAPRRLTATLLLLAALAAIGWLFVPGRAAADTLILPKDKDGNVAVQMTPADGGVTGTLTVINPTASNITVAIQGLGAIANCTFGGATLPAGSTTDVAVKSDVCTLGENGESATMSFTGATIPAVTIQLKPKPVTKPVSLGAALVAFAVVAGAALLLLGQRWLLRPRPEGNPLGLDDDLPGLPAGWTFKDSWATNVGAVSTAFIAIFGTNDVIKALVGDESDTLPGRLLIIAAVSALLIGIAPIVLQTIGPSDDATVRGVFVAAWLTTTAVGGQVLAVYTAFGVTDPTGSAWSDFADGFRVNLSLWVTVALLLLLACYVYRSLGSLLTPPPDTPPTPSDELLVASATLVAAEVCCTEGQQPSTDGHLLAAAYLQAVNYLKQVKDTADAVKAEEKQAATERRGRRRRRTAKATATATATARVDVRFAEPGEEQAATAPAAAPPYRSLEEVIAASAGRSARRSALL